MAKNVVVIGAGAAGLFAAGIAAEAGANVTVLEKNPYPGKKLNITGKGRCNVTNNCTFDELMANVPQNPRFMYSAFSFFSPEDLMNLLENNGLPLKTERGNRVFPVTDKSQSVLECLTKQLRKLNVQIVDDRATEIVFLKRFA